MRHLGIDVHTSSIVFHLLDATGQTLEQGKIATTEQALSSLVMRLGAQELLVGQEVGKMSHFVHDVLTGLGVKVLSFNAHQLRMIASSRKKSDKRDAYWIAKALQSGMTPHPVYIPTGEVRELRALLSQRSALVDERRRWLLRARSYLRAAGHEVKRAPRSVRRLIDLTVSQPEGLDARLYQALSLCQRMDEALTLERQRVEAELLGRAKRASVLRHDPSARHRLPLDVRAAPCARPLRCRAPCARSARAPYPCACTPQPSERSPPATHGSRSAEPYRLSTADFPIASSARSPNAGLVQTTLGEPPANTRSFVVTRSPRALRPTPYSFREVRPAPPGRWAETPGHERR